MNPTTAVAEPFAARRETAAGMTDLRGAVRNVGWGCDQVSGSDKDIINSCCAELCCVVLCRVVSCRVHRHVIHVSTVMSFTGWSFFDGAVSQYALVVKTKTGKKYWVVLQPCAVPHIIV